MEIFYPAWRGRNITTRKDSAGKYAALSGSEALLYIHVSVEENTRYKISLDAARESGNGLVYCNIYGNKNFDFPHVTFLCEDHNWIRYTFEVCSQSFPKTIPMTFRVWRKPNGTGTLLIRSIHVEKIKNSEPAAKEFKVEKTKLGLALKKQKEKPMKIPKSSRRKQKKRKPKPASSREPEYKFPNNPPAKPLPIVVGDDGTKVSVLVSVFNRKSFLERSLITYGKQTMEKKDFEIVVLDVQSTEDIEGLCRQCADKYGLRFQYILVDESKGAIPQKAFTPALTNNIGFKHARGTVVVVTGPETLQKEENLALSWTHANEGYCVYGDIYRSNTVFMKNLLAKSNFEELSFDEIIRIRGAKADASVTTGYWWYYIAIRKEHILSINGVDERYMLGITGEDDDLAKRMIHSGIPLCRDHGIIGIHQDHSEIDRSDKHSIRFNKGQWRRLRNHNFRMLKQWETDKEPVANKNIQWGSEDAIIKKEIF